MTGDLDDIRDALRWPYACGGEIRITGWRGLRQPCNRAAVALRVDQSSDAAYPVCAVHARGDLVPLVEIAAALRRFGAGGHA